MSQPRRQTALDTGDALTGDDLPDAPWAQAFDDRADRADILACFRLILGRNPNFEEWSGHSARAGEELSSVVGSYINSLEFSRRRLQAPSVGEVGPQIAQWDGFRILASPDDPAVGRHVLAGVYEPEVVTVFRDVLRPGMGVVDIGANIGLFTMLAASLVGPSGAVLAVEPNPRNARLLEASRRLNGFDQVTVLQAAAGQGIGLLALNTSFTNGTTSRIEDGLELQAETVPCVAVDPLVPRTPRVGLVKLDVEGAEYKALLGCREMLQRDRPVIVLEFGPSQLPGISGVTGEQLLDWIIAQGYELEVIEPSGPTRPVGRDTAAVIQTYEARGHDHIDLVARPLTQPVPSLLRRLITDRQKTKTR